jgi:Na+-transporting NADH:ubiquinone oxidoreductase subunit NqrF
MNPISSRNETEREICLEAGKKWIFELTKEEIESEKQAANRLSVYQCKQRRKQRSEDLQSVVSDLTKETEKQAIEINQLNEFIKIAYNENRMVQLDLELRTRRTINASTIIAHRFQSLSRC